MARRRLSHAIVLDFMRLIGSGDIEPGSALPPESALGEQYAVGRSVVREALQALHAKGFIVVRQGSVATVAARQHWNVLDSDFLAVHSGEEFFLDVQVAREVLEPQIAFLAADNATPDDLRDMREAVTDMRTAASAREHAIHDVRFHRALAEASGNAILSSFHDSLSSLGERTRSASTTVPGAVERANEWHERILAAITARDPESAAAAMRLHLRQVRDEIEHLEPLHEALG